jgi:hypothetical protein
MKDMGLLHMHMGIWVYCSGGAAVDPSIQI